MKLHSFKWWLLISINLLMLVTLTITGSMAYFSALDELDEVYDAQLAHNARMLVILNNHALLDKGEVPIEIPVPKINDLGEELTAKQQRQYAVHKYENKIAFQIWHNNVLLMHSQNANHFKLSKPQSGYHEIRHDDYLWVTYSLYDPVTDVWVYTAQREDVRQELSEHLAEAEIRPLAFMFIPLSLLIYVLISLTLRPIHRLSDQLTTRQASDLSPIQITLPHELTPIRHAINQLLGRISAYLNKEKRFIADASHELRTPLAVMQIHAENLAANDTDAEQKGALEAIRTGCKNMAHLVDQLLAMAKLEGTAPVAIQNTSIKALIESSLSQLPVELLERMQWSVSVTGSVRVDPVLMAVALRNILENAAKYSPIDSEVAIHADKADSDGIVLTIRNQMTHAPDIEHIEERFYRDRQSQQISGSGLGLSIVRLIINLHEMTINYSKDNKWFDVQILFKENRH